MTIPFYTSPLQFENVAVGKKAKANITLGKRIRGIVLECWDTANEAYSSILEDISVVIDNVETRIHTAAQLNALNLANGTAFGAQTNGINAGTSGHRSYLPLYFEQPWSENRLAGALPTNKLAMVQINAGIAAAATGAALQGTLITDDVTSDEKPFVVRYTRHELSVAGTDQGWPTLPSLEAWLSLSLWDPATEDVDEITLRDSLHGIIHDQLSWAQMKAINKLFWEMDAVDGRFDIPFDGAGKFAGALNPVPLLTRLLKLKFSGASAGTVTALLQSVGRVGSFK